MKPHEIVWTEFAVSCLNEIYQYLLEESHSETIASKHINQLISSVSHLSKYPEAGKTEPLLTHTKQGSRFIVVGNYKILYQVKELTVIITDVFHTAQNPRKIIKRSKRK